MVFPEDGPLEIALNRIEYLDFELFGVEPRGGSNELEASQILARIAAIEGTNASCRAFRTSSSALI